MQLFAREWTSLEVRDAELFPVGVVVISKSHVYAEARLAAAAVLQDAGGADFGVGAVLLGYGGAGCGPVGLGVERGYFKE